MKRLLLFIMAALTVFALPGAELVVMARARLTGTHVLLLGGSTLTHRSDCDADRRTIPMMMADETGLQVLDLSQPDQTLEQSVNIAAASLANPSLRRIVLALALPDLAEVDTTPWREAMLHRVWNPRLAQSGLLERSLKDRHPFEQSPFEQSPFEQSPLEQSPPKRSPFERSLRDIVPHDPLKPTAGGIGAAARQHCQSDDPQKPDQPATNELEAYGRLPIQPSLITLLGSLRREASRANVQLDVFLLPVNVERMGRLSPELVQSFGIRVERLRAALARQGIALADLSVIAGHQEFDEHGCVCGHLQAAGRLKVARQLVEPRHTGTRPRTDFANAQPAGRAAVGPADHTR